MRKQYPYRLPLGWLLPFLWAFFTRETVAQQLETYLQEATANNPGLRASHANFQAAVQKAAQAGQLPSPTVSVGYFVTPVETRVGPQQLSFGFSQNLPGLGYLTAQKKQNGCGLMWHINALRT